MNPADNALTRCRKAVAEILNAADVGITVHPYVVPSADGVSGFVHCSATTSHGTRQTSVTVELRVVVWVPSSNDRLAQEALDALIIGPTSVRALLSEDPTLRGTVESSAVASESNTLDMAQWAAVEGWSHEWRVTAELSNGDKRAPST